MASQVKFFIVALALIAGIAFVKTVAGQDYDDENSQNQGNDGFGGYSSNDGDDDYAAPRDQGMAGADGSEQAPGYHQNSESNADSYDDSAAAASNTKPTLAKLLRPANQ